MVISLLKIISVGRYDLFSDEAFYWQCAQRLEIHFADLPFMTALLVRIGTVLAGNTLLGVRMIFLLLGLFFPLAVYHLALPLVGRLNALGAAGCALALPILGTVGVMAIPDVPLWLYTALFLLGFERATRENSLKFWLLTGICAAAGLVTHYRFILAPGSALLYLVLTKNGRRQWKNWKLWFAIAVMMPGLYPSVTYNLASGFAPLGYYVGARHGSSINLSALPDYLANQAAVVTPLLYAAILLTLLTLAMRTRKGDDRAALMLIFSLVPLLTYTLASPLHDSRLITLHWAVPGYIPLLVYLPETLASFVDRHPTRLRKIIAAMAPGLGAALLILLLLEISFGLIGVTRLQRHIGGRGEVAHTIEKEYLAAFKEKTGIEESKKPVIVADNYILAANLEFRLDGQAEVYTLDHYRNRADGRSRQFEIWGTSESSLRDRAGEDALVIVQPRIIRKRNREDWMIHINSFFEQLELLDDIYIDIPSRKGFAPDWMMTMKFSVYHGHSIKGVQTDPKNR